MTRSPLAVGPALARAFVVCPAICLVVGLVGAPAVAHAGARVVTGDAARPATAAESDRSRAGGIVIDVAGLEPIDPSIRADLVALLIGKADPVIARYPVPADKIRLVVSWRDAASFDYRVRLEIAAHDGVDRRVDDRPTGPDTEQSELGDVIEAALERALTQWSREHERRATAAEPVRPTATVDAGDRKPGRLGPKGWVGVGLTAGGAAALGAGIALLVIDPTPHPTDETRLRSWTPGGIAFTTAGGAALVTGAVLLVLDRRDRRAPRKVAWTPTLGRHHAGITAIVRF